MLMKRWVLKVKIKYNVFEWNKINYKLIIMYFILLLVIVLLTVYLIFKEKIINYLFPNEKIKIPIKLNNNKKIENKKLNPFDFNSFISDRNLIKEKFYPIENPNQNQIINYLKQFMEMINSKPDNLFKLNKAENVIMEKSNDFTKLECDLEINYYHNNVLLSTDILEVSLLINNASEELELLKANKKDLINYQDVNINLTEFQNNSELIQLEQITPNLEMIDNLTEINELL